MGTLTSPLTLWFGSALEFIPVKYVPNETTDLLGELHQFSSLLFQLLLKATSKKRKRRPLGVVLPDTHLEPDLR